MQAMPIVLRSTIEFKRTYSTSYRFFTNNKNNSTDQNYQVGMFKKLSIYGVYKPEFPCQMKAKIFIFYTIAANHNLINT